MTLSTIAQRNIKPYHELQYLDACNCISSLECLHYPEKSRKITELTADEDSLSWTATS